MSSEFFLETLEPRIAPAVVINVGGADGTKFDQAPFQVADSSSSDAGIADLFAANEAGHYYLVLNSGDKVKLVSSSSGYQDYITVTGGKAIAFFFDKNHNNEVESNELTGFSVAGGTGLTVVGSVDGDIVGNLDGKTGLLSEHSLLNDATSLSKLNIQGSITSGLDPLGGTVVAGGKISNVTIAGAVNVITTGTDGSFQYDFGGTGATVGTAFLDPFAPTKAAGAITNVSVAQVNTIQGGVGGVGSVGGSISGVQILSDTNGFQILGGAGGIGTKGGAGGSVGNILVYGVDDSTDNSLITIQGGDGADANPATGTGGAGGAVTNVAIGFDSTALVQSAFLLHDNVTISSGNGGAGKTGGNAGLVSGLDIAILTPDGAGDEIVVHGGNGGDGSGKNGAGGGVSDVTASNYLPILTGSDGIAIAGGAGGIGGGDGAAGGSVSKLTLLGDQITITGGAGSDGIKKAGAGGSVTGVTLAFVPGDLIHVEHLSITGGAGGLASTGIAGAGGSISDVAGTFTDIRGLTNQLTAGAGGDSASGTGGNGGSIHDVSLFEPGLDGTAAGLAFFAGAGGDGVKKGGDGGLLKDVSFFGFATLITAQSGDGGDASGGAAGSGGRIDNFSSQALSINLSLGDVTLIAGDGGNGAGKSGRGGGGGSIATGNIATNDDIVIQAGNGGQGDIGTAGAGGSLSGLAATSTGGSVSMIAGSANAAGTEKSGAVGGAVTDVAAIARSNVTVTAGDGAVGGAGGSVKTLAWYGINTSTNKADVAYAPTGAIAIQAGEGSVGMKTGGVGGSITSATGFVSTDPFSSTTLTAGNGNGGVVGAKAAAGGSISDVTLLASTHSFFAGTADLIAGNGGSLNLAGSAGAGGSISGVSAGAGVDIKSVLAGAGGDSVFLKGKGGVGGSVSNLNIFGNIGVLQEANFGIDGMGGIFAGTGGAGDPANAALNGKAGNVISVTADSIAAIVAGRPTVLNPETFQLVTLVDKVSLRALVAPTVDPLTGAFTNFDEANIVGGISGDPTDNGANIFKIDVAGTPTDVSSTEYAWDLGTTKPLDGLVAAVTLGSKNFRPEALLQTSTTSGTGYVLLDYRNDFNVNS